VPQPLFELIAFVLGLVLGSFLNVCISRLPRGESIVQPRSRCLFCHHTIHWYDNVPVLSFLFLRGRCHHCKKPISWRYPLVELATGLWFAFVGNLLWKSWYLPGDIANPRALDPAIPLTSQAIALAILGFFLIGLLVMDWQTQRLPDTFTITGIAIGFFLTCIHAIFLNPGEDQILLPAEHMRLRSPGSGAVEGNVFLTGPEALVFGRLGAIVAVALVLLAIRWLYRRLRGREGMGLGDVKLLAMIAAFLGLAQSLLALFFGVLTAAVFGVALLISRRAGITSRLPFGSFLCAGGLFAAAFGERVIHWYGGLLR
jgi:leader peptidase (prepilin peptidase)/N-methyltransferase